MKKRYMLIALVLLSITFFTFSFIPKSASSLCLYVPDPNGGCVLAGKVDIGTTAVTGKLLQCNNGTCPPAPAQCDDQVEIQPQQ